MTAANNTISRANAVAKEMGLDFRYIYQNYASQNQRIFKSYGEENHERLRRIRKKYDPLVYLRSCSQNISRLDLGDQIGPNCLFNECTS